ncbi:MAG: hypothetical protein AAB375_01380 [Patescibacteria group bacterium]
MRIKPAIVTGVATVVAMVAVAVVVMATEPSQAQPELVRLLWAALFLTMWGFLCTILLLLRQTIAQALWTALPPAIAAVGLLMALQREILGARLLGGVILATLVLSSVIRWKLR